MPIRAPGYANGSSSRIVSVRSGPTETGRRHPGHPLDRLDVRASRSGRSVTSARAPAAFPAGISQTPASARAMSRGRFGGSSRSLVDLVTATQTLSLGESARSRAWSARATACPTAGRHPQRRRSSKPQRRGAGVAPTRRRRSAAGRLPRQKLGRERSSRRASRSALVMPTTNRRVRARCARALTRTAASRR